MKYWFSSKYEPCFLKKSIKIEAVFTKKEMNNEWNFNFIQNSPIIFPKNFELAEMFLQMSSTSSNLTFQKNVEFRKPEKVVLPKDFQNILRLTSITFFFFKPQSKKSSEFSKNYLINFY